LKIYNFILDHRLGGPHAYVLSLARQFAEFDVESKIVTAGTGPVTDIPLFRLRHFGRVLYLVEVILNVLRIIWLMRKVEFSRASVFDVHGVGNIAPLIAFRILRLPVIWHFHEANVGPTIEGLGVLGRKLVRGLSHHIIAVSHRAATVHQSPQATVLYAPIDLDFWKLSDGERKCRLDNIKLKIVSVGNLNPLKGFDILLDAVARLDIPVDLVIVGSVLDSHRAYGELLFRKAKDLQLLGHTVRFTGWVEASQVRSEIATSNIFVLASKSEAGPMVLYEAMALETVCIISDVGDAREVLGTGTGYVLQRMTPGRIVNAIKRAEMLGPAGRSKMGSLARSAIKPELFGRTIAEQHIDIYRKMLCLASNSL
jgi:glycosyltransferase involved in cell wall biosynthesis